MKAVIYARYSCDNQREESIEGQLRECKVFADRNGYILVGTYIDKMWLRILLSLRQCAVFFRAIL